MPKIEQKQVVVDEIKDKLSKATSVVLLDSRGLSVEQDTTLRKKLRDAGVDYKVYKNTMLTFAVEGTPYEPLKDYFKGPTTAAICYEESTIAARIIHKEQKNMPIISFKAGVLDNTMYDGASIEAIAGIPSKEELLAKLLGSFKSPIASFARVINAIAEDKEKAQ